MSRQAGRVAITGMGCVSPIGSGVPAFAAALREGRSGIGTLSLFEDTGYRSTAVAEVGAFDVPELPPAVLPRNNDVPPHPALARRASSRLGEKASHAVGLPRIRTHARAFESQAGRGDSEMRSWLLDHDAPRASQLRRTSRSALLALAAAAEALGQAEAATDGMGVVVGTTTGGMRIGEEAFTRFVNDSRRKGALSEWLETPVSSTTDVVARLVGAGGPRLTVSTACSSGANALGIGSDWIRSGRAKAVLAGGTDALCRMTLSGFNALQAIDKAPCRPFDRTRAGLNLGEGAAFVVLEPWDAAKTRGATILAELVSYGISADAHHPTQPHPEATGPAAALREALATGGIDAAEVDYVNAHGTGTPLNDSMETRALVAVLGDRARKIPVSSTKSMIGHTLGAAGAIEAVASIVALREGFVPPTLRLADPDPECDLDHVPDTSRPASLRTVVSNSYGFGGNNTSLILRRAD